MNKSEVEKIHYAIDSALTDIATRFGSPPGYMFDLSGLSRAFKELDEAIGQTAELEAEIGFLRSSIAQQREESRALKDMILKIQQDLNPKEK